MKTAKMEKQSDHNKVNNQNNSNNQNQKNMKTIISIPQCVTTHTLTLLGKYEIPCKYLGLDQSGRMLMEAEHQSGQKALMQTIIADMQEGERSVDLLLAIGNEILTEAIEKVKASQSLTPRYKTSYLD